MKWNFLSLGLTLKDLAVSTTTVYFEFQIHHPSGLPLSPTSPVQLFWTQPCLLGTWCHRRFPVYFAAGITCTQLATVIWPPWHLFKLAVCLGLLFQCCTSVKKQTAVLPRECRHMAKASKEELKPFFSDHCAPTESRLAWTANYYDISVTGETTHILCNGESRWCSPQCRNKLHLLIFGLKENKGAL